MFPKRYYDEGSQYGYGCKGLFPHMEETTHISEAELVVFGGGEDISPNFYGHKNVASGSSNHDREIFDQQIFEACVDDGGPMLGICRGAQILNCMNGGKLVQDIPGHTRHHYITLSGYPLPEEYITKNIAVTSTHHQMMIPAYDGLILGYATLNAQTDKQLWKYDERMLKDRISHLTVVPEVVYYPATKSLCVQFHPEYEPHGRGAEWVRKFLKAHFNLG